jgi:hypothetical protein
MKDDPDVTSTVREEEEAAAAEARRIGGRSGMEGMDPAKRASAEHGGGEAEGFEEAEDLLEEQATHGDSTVDPLRDAPAPEAEEQVAVYGEADEVDVEQDVRDAEDESAA